MKKEMTKFSDLTNVFRREITLKMRLEPVTFMDGKIVFLPRSAFEIPDKTGEGKTTLTTNDEDFFNKYQELKPVINKYHQIYIQRCLSAFVSTVKNEDAKDENSFCSLVLELLQLQKAKKQAKDDSSKNDANDRINLVVLQLTKRVSDELKNATGKVFYTNDFAFSDLTKKKFIEKELNSFVNHSDNNVTPSEKELVVSICKDTKLLTRMSQYCGTLLKNRNNIYGMKKNSVAYRCIHENLFRFISICGKSEKIIKVLGEGELSRALNVQISTINKDAHTISDIFAPHMFYLYMSQDGIDGLNSIISSLNIRINEYNQQLKSLELTKKEYKEKRLYPLNDLYKQILSEKEDTIERIKDADEVELQINQIIKIADELELFTDKLNNPIQRLLCTIENYDLSQIYLDSNKLFNISMEMFGDGLKLRNMIKWRKDNRPATKTVSLSDVNTYIKDSLDEVVNVCDFFKELKVKDGDAEEVVNIFDLIHTKHVEYVDCQGTNALVGKRKHALKQLLDAINVLCRMLKTLSCPEDVTEYDSAFYAELNKYISKLGVINHKYNLIRNYVLQLHDRGIQMPLMFGEDSKEFLNGWTIADDQHGTRHRGYLFRKEVGCVENEVFYDYYLGIANSHSLFPRRKTSSRMEGDCDLQHLVYYQTTQDTFKKQFMLANDGVRLNEPEMNLHKWVLSFIDGKITETSKSQLFNKKNELKPSMLHLYELMVFLQMNEEELFKELTAQKEFIKRDNDYVAQLVKAAHSVSRIYEFSSYDSKGEHSWKVLHELLYMADSCCSKSYEYVSSKDLQKVIDGYENRGKTTKLHLFRISNKDLNFFVPNEVLLNQKPRTSKRGKENLHTMYFRSMMNDQESVFDIKAGKVMYRRASKKMENPTHEPGMLKNKNEQNPKEYSEFKYPLYKDKRYMRDQMTFHISMVQNYKAFGDFSLNDEVKEYLKNKIKENKPINIIGIDRGERNLLYVTLMSSDGTIKCQRSLNVIRTERGEAVFLTDFHKRMKDKEDKIKKQREDWDELDKFANLKEGYLSLAVHEIAKMAVENEAIIVMEKLSKGFMSARQKYLANVYQMFENMLVRKLSFYTDKDMDKNKPGGVLNALQLVEPVSVDLHENDDRVEQNGIIFYVPAWMTSKIDPVTGFANLLSEHLHFGTLAEARCLVEKFKSIGYNSSRQEYEFIFNYKDFGVSVDSVNVWKIGTHGQRIVAEKNEKGFYTKNKIALTEKFDDLFTSFRVQRTNDMKEAVLNYDIAKHENVIHENGNKGFFEELFKLIRYMLMLRNSDKDAIKEEDKDYIISPVVMADGNYYLSSKYIDVTNPEKQQKAILPVDSDANGAYNIARKGIIVLNCLDKKTIKITQKDWLEFAQRNYRNTLND